MGAIERYPVLDDGKTGAARVLRFLFAFALFLAFGGLSGAAPIDEREYALKAAFLYHLTQFIEWPPEAMPSPGGVFRIGVLRPNPFGTMLDKVVRDQRVGGIRIEVVYLDDIDEANALQMLFVPRDAVLAPEAISRAAGQAILLVGEDLAFLRAGGMISLVRQQERVAIYINRGSLVESGLSASARLLRLATNMEDLPGQ